MNFKDFSRPNKEIKYFSKTLTEFKDFSRQLLKFKTFQDCTTMLNYCWFDSLSRCGVQRHCLVSFQSSFARIYHVSSRHGSYNLDQVLNLISHLEKSLNSVKLFEKYLISLLGLETSLNFSTFLFLFLYFKWYFCTSERLQESYPMTVVILHSVVTINYGWHRKNHKWLRWVF